MKDRWMINIWNNDMDEKYKSISGHADGVFTYVLHDWKVIQWFMQLEK